MPAFAERTWGATQEHLRSLLGSDTYDLWFAPLRARAQDNNSLVLEVSDDFCEIWLKENYVGLLEDAVALVSGQRLKIRFEVCYSEVGTPLEDPNPGPISTQVASGAAEPA
jgi:chromosomal replication initiator protein